MASDASALLDYTKRAKGKPRGVATPLKATAMNPNAKRSIFSRSDYGMLIVDEVHLHRTGGASYDGLLQLRDKSLFVLAMTATPLFTSTRVRHMIPYPCGNFDRSVIGPQEYWADPEHSIFPD